MRLSHLLTLLPAVSVALTTNTTIYQPNVPIIPSPLPPPGPASHTSDVITQFSRLGRTTQWNLIKTIHISSPDTGEPEGMINLHESRFLISRGNWTTPTEPYPNGTIINGTNRTPGAGSSHLTIYDGSGNPIADARLTAPGAIEYHVGGIDYDGERVWATLAQYRPNTTATVVTIDPVTLAQTVVARYRDHLGGVVHDKAARRLTTLNWGARNASLWDLAALPTGEPGEGVFSEPSKVVRNPSLYVDYQDCKFLGRAEVYQNRPVMICGGITAYAGNFTLGGLAIVDVETMLPYAEVPLTLKSELGANIASNPFDVDVVDGRMRFYFMPDQHNSTIYIYEAEENSPFQYGGGEL